MERQFPGSYVVVVFFFFLVSVKTPFTLLCSLFVINCSMSSLLSSNQRHSFVSARICWYNFFNRSEAINIHIKILNNVAQLCSEDHYLYIHEINLMLTLVHLQHLLLNLYLVWKVN